MRSSALNEHAMLVAGDAEYKRHVSGFLTQTVGRHLVPIHPGPRDRQGASQTSKKRFRVDQRRLRAALILVVSEPEADSRPELLFPKLLVRLGELELVLGLELGNPADNLASLVRSFGWQGQIESLRGRQLNL